jgi:hypothetical protein
MSNGRLWVQFQSFVLSAWASSYRAKYSRILDSHESWHEEGRARPPVRLV